MNISKTRNLWRALLVALFCIWSLPQLAGAAPLAQIPTGPGNAYIGIPDYYTTPNWANSPPLAKFVDTLPGLTPAGINNLNQYLPVAVPDTTTFPGSDYYIIKLVEYYEKMHTDLQPTKLRGYVQLNSAETAQVDNPHYLGPVIVATKDRPIRIKFINGLSTGAGGNLFIPVDESVMGAGEGPITGTKYTQNRANIHLHGGRTPWISDGTPHQWITPAGENTPYVQGVSVQNVPDMCFEKVAPYKAIPKGTDPNCLTGTSNPGPGANSYYFTNQQSTRLMFYHDHAFGITRLNVYAGMAAAYVITDPMEQDLIDRGIIPGTKTDTTISMGGMIPLVIQDKTYVNADVTTHPHPTLGGGKVTTVRETDPLWNWGSKQDQAVNGVVPPTTGDLWLPHVYMPAQLPETSTTGGVNPFGRWMYGPWFYPATAVTHGPVPNPYYDPNCSSSNPFELAQCQTPGQPTLIPGTPNVSMGMEAFQDSVVVNGTVFPSITVDPKAYRFRILNAASDRFWNLSFYIADADPANASPDPRLLVAGKSNLTEVKMVPASAQLALDYNWPADWPVDGRDGGVPDPGLCVPAGSIPGYADVGGVNCPNLGPAFLQIGTEGGFLPAPTVRVPQPVTYITDPTAFWVGVVDKTGLSLGPAERADAIVDFSAYAGKTLILYNDAPAAWPARVPGYDYFTGAPDMRDSGGYGTGGVLDPATGAWVVNPANPNDIPRGILPGYAPNTRTVMQVIVRAGTVSPFDSVSLVNEFTSAAPATTLNPLDPATGRTKTLFERTQEPIIVGQAAYSSAYPDSYFPPNFPWEGVTQINDEFLQFVTLAGEKVNIPTEPKGIHDEMGASFDPEYGRMSGNLAMQLGNASTLNALLVLYGFSDIPTETVKNSTSLHVEVLPNPNPDLPGSVTDGTQIWKISHNGVDTHPIHFHIFDVQLINRVGWDGQIAMPEANEIGWKDTVKISPLMDTIVAVRPRAPALPFGIPNSMRPLNPAIPIDSAMDFTTPSPGSDWALGNSYLSPYTPKFGFSSIDWITGETYGTNNAPVPYNYYKGIVTNVLYDFGWEYVWHCHILSHEEMDMMRPIVLKYDSLLPPTFTAFANGDVITWNDPTPVTYVTTDPETYRNDANEIGFNVYRSDDGTFPVDPQTGSATPVNDSILPANTTSFTATGTGNYFIVEAFNASGSTYAYVNYQLAATVSATGEPFTSPGPVNLSVALTGFAAGITISKVDFYTGSILIGSDTTGPYELTWNGAAPGTHSITARVYHNNLGGVVVSDPLSITVAAGTNPLVADFTPNDGSSSLACDAITFTSTSTGPITGYSWLINGVTYTTANTTIAANTLAPGSYPVTLTVTSSTTGEVAQIVKTITITNNAPTVTSTGGPYSVVPGDVLNLVGTGVDADACSTLSYGWDVDGKNGYEFLTANPSIPYDALMNVLGGGVHTIFFRVSDANGGEATASTTLTVNGGPTVAITAPANGATIAYGSPITITATATDPVPTTTITSVEFYDGATLLFTATTAPYSYTITAPTLGAHSFTAKATNSTTYTSTSAAVNVTVAAQVPTVSVTVPVTGATYTSGATIPLTATAGSDPLLTITKVEFFDGATLLGTDTTAPYSYNWVGAAVGAHTVTAKVTDSSGAVITSSVINLTVSATKAVRIVRGLTTLEYATLQEAYNAALTDETILLAEGVLTGTLLANQPKVITLKGGYDLTFTTNNSMTKVGVSLVRSGTLKMIKVSLM